MEPTTIDRTKSERILTLIRELMKKTTAAGCTEAEADAAAQKVDELMESYDISMTDVKEVEGDTYGAGKRTGYTKGRNANRTIWHEINLCFGSVAHFCDCRTWYSRNTAEVTYFGSHVDVELAFFLTDTIKHAMDTEWNAYRRQHGLGQRGRAAFMIAMASRVNRRLGEMKRARAAAVNQERGLMVLTKDAVVKRKHEQYLAMKGIHLRAGRRGPINTIYNGTRDAGAAAGDRVGLSRPVSAGAGGRLLTGK